ncbi:hypothetical protein [Halomicronema sp. CCY15110]|uniref:hypothetical protein n=1 Tax=Halomicronema sp. CCY15110 TaxID=2767773 RepID=UPI0019523BF4|nr:hypothetical protein [Halomicronema sp. CCY15110]
MLIKSLVVIGSAIAASGSLATTVLAQPLPPTVTIGDTDYKIEFKLGVFGDHIVELQAQPWYSKNDFTFATKAARQVFDCAAGSPFDRPICATPFDAFGATTVNTAFGGASPWFVYDVEAGVAAVAVGFSDVAGGANVLSQIAADLDTQQTFAMVTPTRPVAEAQTTIPEPTSWMAIIAVGAIALGSRWVHRH